VNIASVLDPVAAAEPSRAALVVDERVVTYEELDRAVRACAAALTAHGVGSGDRVAVVEVGGLLSTAVILA
jgi:long-chain acyl-CoA synthetase